MLFHHVVLTCYNLHSSVMMYFATEIWNNSINILDIKQKMDKRGNKKIRLFFFFSPSFVDQLGKRVITAKGVTFVCLCHTYMCVRVCTYTLEMIHTLECQPNLSIPR